MSIKTFSPTAADIRFATALTLSIACMDQFFRSLSGAGRSSSEFAAAADRLQQIASKRG